MHMRALANTYWKHWLRWSEASVNRRIFAAAVTVGVSTLAVNLAFVLRDAGIAGYFGRGDEVDAFLIAFLLPSFAINVIAGSFSAAFIPTYMQVREDQGDHAAGRLFSGVTLWGLGLLAAIAALLGVLSGSLLPVLASGFSGEKLALTRSLFILFLPLIVLSGIATLWSSLLNARKRFVISALAPIMPPLAALAGLFAAGRAWGIYALAIGIMAGTVLQGLVLAAALKQEDIRLRPRWQGMTPELRRVLGQYLPMVAGALLMSMTGVVDQGMAAMLDPGSVAALSYGTKIVTFVVGLGTMAIGTAILPHFSQMAGAKDWQAIRHTARTYSRLILLLCVPVTLMLVLLAEPVISVLFERGAFVRQDVQLVGRVLAFASLQVPFYLLGILYVRLISSLQRNTLLLWGAAISLPLDVVLNLVFMRWMGVSGIALSTSIVMMVSCCYLLLSAEYALRKAER